MSPGWWWGYSKGFADKAASTVTHAYHKAVNCYGIAALCMIQEGTQALKTADALIAHSPEHALAAGDRRVTAASHPIKTLSVNSGGDAGKLGFDSLAGGMRKRLLMR